MENNKIQRAIKDHFNYIDVSDTLEVFNDMYRCYITNKSRIKEHTKDVVLNDNENAAFVIHKVIQLMVMLQREYDLQKPNHGKSKTPLE